MKNNNQNIIYSVVLCTYNREAHIEQCLESLVNQNFPKEKYEIIVVDDCSTDSTRELIKKYPVRLVQHKTNQGIATARNSGMKAAKGKIYVSFDDDSYADKNWLKNLSKIYESYNQKNISGVAGLIKLKNTKPGIIEKYMDAIGYANPSPVSYVTSKSLFMRFYAYLKNMFTPSTQINQQIFGVGEIWGANCSFPMSILKKVNGWDDNLSWAEDTDLCDKINKQFPNNKFICTKNAILFHDHRLSLKQFLLKPYTRAEATLRFYMKNNKIPPIFPFPIMIGLFCLLLMILNPLYSLFGLIFFPPLFYSWWILKGIQKKDFAFFTFPYLQYGYELFTILGLLRGYIKTFKI